MHKTCVTQSHYALYWVPSEIFEAELPRQEVKAELLHAFETGLLPTGDEHGNKKSKPGWVKGFKQAVILFQCLLPMLMFCAWSNMQWINDDVATVKHVQHSSWGEVLW